MLRSRKDYGCGRRRNRSFTYLRFTELKLTLLRPTRRKTPSNDGSCHDKRNALILVLRPRPIDLLNRMRLLKDLGNEQNVRTLKENARKFQEIEQDAKSIRNTVIEEEAQLAGWTEKLVRHFYLGIEIWRTKPPQRHVMMAELTEYRANPNKEELEECFDRSSTRIKQEGGEWLAEAAQANTLIYRSRAAKDYLETNTKSKRKRLMEKARGFAIINMIVDGLIQFMGARALVVYASFQGTSSP